MNALYRKWIGATLWLVARLWLAYQFLDAGSAKLFGDSQAAFVGAKAGAGVKGFLLGATSAKMTSGSHAAVLPLFQWFAQNLFIPAATPLGYLVAFGEFLVGLAMLVGIFTRFAAFWAVVLNLMFLLAGSAGLNPYMLTIDMAILLSGTTAGLIGLDYFVMPLLKKEWTAIHWHLPHGQTPQMVH